jgi:hypothetical protein
MIVFYLSLSLPPFSLSLSHKTVSYHGLVLQQRDSIGICPEADESAGPAGAAHIVIGVMLHTQPRLLRCLQSIEGTVDMSDTDQLATPHALSAAHIVISIMLHTQPHLLRCLQNIEEVVDTRDIDQL